MATLDIKGVLTKLAARRPVFHSEADFQNAFAWEIHLAYEAASLRLEKNISAEQGHLHLDLLVQLQKQEIAIELKYKKGAVRIVSNGEVYALRNQGAQDTGRYDFIKDVWRLEPYTNSHPRSVGWAILLTNEPKYWSESRRPKTVDSQFRLHEGRVLQGCVAWSNKAAAGTKHKREKASTFQGQYQISWQDFSSHEARPAGTFRYLAVRVPNAG